MPNEPSPIGNEKRRLAGLALSVEVVLLVLLGVGGFGLGTGFATLIGHLTNAVPERYAPDISGVATTALQIGGAIGVAAFGSLYLAPHRTVPGQPLLHRDQPHPRRRAARRHSGLPDHPPTPRTRHQTPAAI